MCPKAPIKLIIHSVFSKQEKDSKVFTKVCFVGDIRTWRGHHKNSLQTEENLPTLNCLLFFKKNASVVVGYQNGFQEEYLWGMLAGMATSAKNISAAEIAYAALDEVRVLYLWFVPRGNSA